MLLAQNIDGSKIQDTFELTGDSISFPITIVNTFPFITGEVNGIKGKLMFDTGNQNALDINNNIVPLASQTEKGNGQVGSGQKFTKYTNYNIEDVKLVNGLRFQNLKEIPSGNYDFLQKNITPDCTGYIGYDFFKGYLFKLDYTKRKITFYRNTPNRKSTKDFLNGEDVLAVLNFETRRLPNHPMIKVKVDDVEMLASFDTGGSNGGLEISGKDAQKLMKRKKLLPYGKDGYDDELVSLYEVELAPKLSTDLIGIYKESADDNSHVRKALEISEQNFLTLAYRFLAQYKTVWDYDNKKIYVLAY
jgi:hypothetical protein